MSIRALSRKIEVGTTSYHTTLPSPVARAMATAPASAPTINQTVSSIQRRFGSAWQQLAQQGIQAYHQLQLGAQSFLDGSLAMPVPAFAGASQLITPATVSEAHPSLWPNYLLSVGDKGPVQQGSAQGSSASARGAKPSSTPPEEPQSEGRFKAAVKKLTRLFWQPLEFKEPVYEWVNKQLRGSTDKDFLQRRLANGNVHHAENPVTQKIISTTSISLNGKKKHETHPHVLELGSGLGVLAKLIEKKLKAKGITVQRTDRNNHIGSHDRFQHADMAAIPYSDGTFPVVVASHAIEYADPIAFKEAFRVLQPGGSIVLLVHHQKSMIVQGMRAANKIFVSPFKFLASLRFFGVPILQTILSRKRYLTWEADARISEELLRVAYQEKADIRELLMKAGFTDVAFLNTIGTMPGQGLAQAADQGWVITAQKPAPRKKVRRSTGAGGSGSGQGGRQGGQDPRRRRRRRRGPARPGTPRKPKKES
jgi:ubiquinone/menaquinone biosynthesis C-methylase UbiE